MSVFMKIYEAIGKVEMWISKGALALLTALVFASALARTLNYPIAWAVDMATFLFAWAVFLSADAAMRKDKLISINLLMDRLPPRFQLYLKILNYAIIIIFLAYMVYYGFHLSYTTRLRTFQGIPGFSYTWVTISVPIGCLLMLTTAVLKVKDLIKGGTAGLKKTEEGSGEIL
jgi:TRAP-type C4-dicarboxylate transport system permease small subunit